MRKTKKSNVKNVATPAPVCVCSRGHRVWSIVALLGLFLCGLMIGLPIGARHNSIGDEKQQLIGMTVQQCNRIANRIVDAMNSYPTDTSLIAELDRVYSNNCAGRVFMQKKEVKVQPSPELQQASNPDSGMRPCERIEILLTDRLGQVENYQTSMYNANIYATMVEYGCPENAEQNRQLALDALQVADALSDNDLVYNESSVSSVVDTYKKLDMQKQAHQFLNKVQKLTDPAIDFILQMEKIINE